MLMITWKIDPPHPLFNHRSGLLPDHPESAPKVFQKCSNSVPKVFNMSHKSDPKVFQKCSNSVPKCPNSVQQVIQK
eukprot:11118442-Heterocapsa_arctica.AAC.1